MTSKASSTTGEGAKEVEILEPEVIEDLDEEAPELLAAGEVIDVDEGEAGLIMWDAFKNLPVPASDVYTDSLSYYMAQLRYIEPLAPELQQELAERYYEDEDLEAASLLVLTNLRLVVKIAREYQRRWADLLDLIQEGNVGLAEAITRHNPYRGVRFTSYAQYWVRAMILNYLMRHFQPIRIGSTRAGRKLFFNLQKAREKLQREGFLNPSPKLIADELGLNEEDVIEVARHLDSRPLSIDAKVPGYDKLTYRDVLSAPESDDPESATATSEVREQISAALTAFGEQLKSDRDRMIWTERLMAESPRTLEDLGDEFKVSKERVRQLEVRIKKQLRAFLEQELGSDIRFNL